MRIQLVPSDSVRGPARAVPGRARGPAAVLGVLAAALLLASAAPAHAKHDQVYRYAYARVWSSALRMLRVDYDSPITEKDFESGYFLFDFPLDGKSNPGSAELVRAQDGGVESVRVEFQLPALPSYVELMLLDRLKRKLSEEFGDPISPKKPPEAGKGDEGKGDRGQGGDKDPDEAPKQPAPGKPDEAPKE